MWLVVAWLLDPRSHMAHHGTPQEELIENSGSFFHLKNNP
jgi:hypothetical protein